ncbi:MAG: DNA-processing protein DprA [Pigmentiphaga sp.]|nr:DNA-processing protein DprA [Pigmentiphaga sp.]
MAPEPAARDAALAAWLRLSLQPGLGLVAARRLLDLAGGDALAVSALAPPDVAGVVGPQPAAELLRPPTAGMTAAIEACLAWERAAEGRRLMVLADADYPASLRQLHDPPLVLYVRGDAAQLARPSVAVVGARHATPGGKALARNLSLQLAASGWSVVSGLALGIDGAAHEGALAAGPEGAGTLAVMATGIDRVYPARHQGLAQRIAMRGAVITELPLGTPSAPFQFPRRNRLVAGLVRGVLVVEAAERSGSLITARLANDLGRDVFAVPGSVHAPLSRGCHALIRDGARLAASLEDILEELEGGAYRPTSGKADLSRQPPAPPDPGEPEAAAVLAALGYDPLDFDTLLARTGLAAPLLHGQLLQLELGGWLWRGPDGRLMRLAPPIRPAG